MRTTCCTGNISSSERQDQEAGAPGERSATAADSGRPASSPPLDRGDVAVDSMSELGEADLDLMQSLAQGDHLLELLARCCSMFGSHHTSGLLAILAGPMGFARADAACGFAKFIFCVPVSLDCHGCGEAPKGTVWQQARQKRGVRSTSSTSSPAAARATEAWRSTPAHTTAQRCAAASGPASCASVFQARRLRIDVIAL